MASAVFGGMGGCAMIGQSVINVSSGARGRLSTLVAGAFLLLLLVALQDLLAVVPVAALTAVMIMVSINTFSWRSLVRLRTNPLPSSAVMLATVLVVVATKDLAIGVLVGVLLSGVFFAGKVSRLNRSRPTSRPTGGPGPTGSVGQVFFASAGTFSEAIDVLEPVERLVIDVHGGAFLGHLGRRRPRPRGAQGPGPRPRRRGRGAERGEHDPGRAVRPARQGRTARRRRRRTEAAIRPRARPLRGAAREPHSRRGAASGREQGWHSGDDVLSARDRVRTRSLHRRAARRQARRRDRAPQPLAPPAAHRAAARGGGAQEHPDDRADRLRQDRDRPAPRPPRQRAVPEDRGHQVHRGRLCRPRRGADRPRPRRGGDRPDPAGRSARA